MAQDEYTSVDLRPGTPVAGERRVRRSAGINKAFRAIKAQHSSNRSKMEIMADRMIGFASSTPFLVIHAIIFVGWIWWNLPFSGLKKFDPYPYGMLTTIVSLEAIFLSCFVLISQNRQAEKDHVKSDIEYEVNIKAELEVAHLHEKTDRIYAEMLEHFVRVEKALDSRGGSSAAPSA